MRFINQKARIFIRDTCGDDGGVTPSSEFAFGCPSGRLVYIGLFGALVYSAKPMVYVVDVESDVALLDRNHLLEVRIRSEWWGMIKNWKIHYMLNGEIYSG